MVATSAELLSFTEESCWTRGEQRRQYLIPVTFTLQSVGKRLGGKRVTLEFKEDYGLYYHSDDDPVIAKLTEVCPDVDWGAYVYYRQADMTKIQVLDPDTNLAVATITTRKYIGKPVDRSAAEAGAYGPNVLSFAGIRGRLDVLASMAAEREMKRKQLHAELRAQGVISDKQ